MIIFEMEYPKRIGDFSTNKIYSGLHWSIRKKHADFWHWKVISALKKEKIPKKFFKKAISVTIYWNDRMDIDNHSYAGKMIVDALRGYLIENDSRKFFKSITHEFHDGKNIKVIISDK